jgi:hypothetical protein
MKLSTMQIILSRVRGSVTNNNGFWITWLDLLALLYNHNQLSQVAINGCLPRPIPYRTTDVFSSTVTTWFWFTKAVTSSASVGRWLTLHSWTLNYRTAFWILSRMPNDDSWMNLHLDFLFDAGDCMFRRIVGKILRRHYPQDGEFLMDL